MDEHPTTASIKFAKRSTCEQHSAHQGNSLKRVKTGYQSSKQSDFNHEPLHRLCPSAAAHMRSLLGLNIHRRGHVWVHNKSGARRRDSVQLLKTIEVAGKVVNFPQNTVTLSDILD
eukprot:6234334-Amphidinium_carterae.1